MSGEQQLERSVLERKERDELQAIAEAMALKPGARTKKADIINQILQATGIELETGEAANGATTESGRPRRGRASRSRPQPEEASNGTVQGQLIASEEPGGSGDPEASEISSEPPAPDTQARPADTQARQDHGSEAPTPAGEAQGGKGGGKAEGAGPGASTEEGGRSEADVAAAGPSEEVRPAQEEARHDGSPDRGAQERGGQERGRNGPRPQQGMGEVGNRRGRRRRGRGGGDRTERDLQGGGQEPTFQGEPVPVKGLLDLREEGFGFLRTSGYLPSSRDVYVSISQARRYGLRKGDYIEGLSRPAASNEKYPAIMQVERVNGMTPDEARQRPRFEDLTPLFPDQRLRLEVPGDSANMTARIVDLLSPIGKGQRGLIVSPPKAGKTTVLQQIAHSIEVNNPEVHLMILLIEERPEEATAWRRSVKGEVIASTFDRPSDEHTAVSELTIERARRLVEQGEDVVIILDGITRLARAYNLAQPATGRIMSGGVDSGALYPPRKFFGAARNIEEGGSLTILATALVETGSRMDEVIFEEFKGTGNMELRLDRRLAERRIYPAIEVNASSTRHEELLFDRSQLQQVWKLRRVLNALSNDGSTAAGLELLMDKIKTTKSNDEFLADIAKGPAPPV
jgi:transcription termination factor Rho